MKKAKLASIVALGMIAISALSSCCSYTNAVAVNPGDFMEAKRGTSTQWTILGTIGVGGPRQSIKNAAKEAGISKILLVEHHDKTYLGIVTKHQIRVYGEE